MSKKLSALLLFLLCSSCTKSVDPPARSQEPQPALPSLAMVTQGDTVEIQNDWNGYSDITPVLRHYKLHLQNRELVGNSHIAVGGYGGGGIRQQATTKVKIPAAVTAQFLAMLSKTPIEIGSYKPTIAHSDDYPHIRILVKFNQQQAIFSSESQGAQNIPWKVVVQPIGTKQPIEDYITSSNIPSQALKLLNPYLDKSGVDRIIGPRQRRK
jgi:hypothetical protein